MQPMLRSLMLHSLSRAPDAPSDRQSRPKSHPRHPLVQPSRPVHPGVERKLRARDLAASQQMFLSSIFCCCSYEYSVACCITDSTGYDPRLTDERAQLFPAIQAPSSQGLRRLEDLLSLQKAHEIAEVGSPVLQEGEAERVKAPRVEPPVSKPKVKCLCFEVLISRRRSNDWKPFQLECLQIPALRPQLLHQPSWHLNNRKSRRVRT
jgi:hypothetical protein